MRVIRILAIISIILYILFTLENMSYGGETHISRGKMLQSLSKYDNNKTHQKFIKTRKPRIAGFQSVITILPQGVSLGATAIVSADRRYVRMGLVPFFSAIGEVTTFNFGKK